MSRRLSVLLLPVLLLAGQLTVVMLEQKPARAACAATAKDEVIAVGLARKCDLRVEIESDRSEFGQTFAEPSGFKTLEISAVPQRAKRRDGSWAAIDTTLQRAGVYLVPAAAASDVRLSTGGQGPFATVTHQGQNFSLSWPYGELPAPTVLGDTATYAGVLPDVDLVVKATESGFSHLLVVKTAIAAKDPRVRQTRYRIGGNAAIESTSDGGLVARAGQSTVATAGAAQMWDTPGHPSDKQLAMIGATPQPRKHSRVATHAVGEDLVVTADAAMLDDPAARFPLTVDPLWNVGQAQWAYTSSADNDSTMFDETISGGDPIPAAPILRSGNDTVGRVNRSFMRFDILGLSFKQILDANISGRVDHTWICNSPRPNYFYRTAGITAVPRQAWPGPNLELYLGNNNVFANEAACTNPNMGFEVSSGTLINDLQMFVSNGWGSYYVGICACSDGSGTGEWTQDRWMRYFLNDFRLNITYNTKPNKPDSLTVDGKACVAGTNRPFIKTTTPTLRAHVTDQDGDSLNTSFVWAKWNGTSFVDNGSGTQNNVPSNGTALLTATGNVNGGIYTFRAQSNDGHIASDVTHMPGDCEWQVDTSAPAVPTVTADVYLEGQSRGAPGQNGKFTFSSSSDTKSFLFGFSDPPTTPMTPSALGGSVTINYNPPTSGPRTLYVRAIDRAGNESNKVYQFIVAAETTAVGRWLLNDFPGTTTLADDTGNGNTLTAVNGPQLGAPGRIAPGNDPTSRTSLNFDGVNDAATRPALIDTSRSFSVSAWVKLDAKAGVDQTIASQQGAYWSAFYLQYDASLDRWVIEAPSSEAQTPTPTWYSAKSTTVPKPGVWTHLVGTYDPAAKQLKIYVNGVLEGTSTGLVAWNATGEFRVGRAGSNWFDGSIAEVQVWNRMISATEVFSLYDPLTKALVAKWDMSDVGPGPTFDASNFAHDLEFFPQPGGPQIPQAGSGHTGTGLSLDGIDDYARTGEPVLYTDQSFTVSVWVFLPTTVTGNRTAISQHGTSESGFFLKYEGTDGRWYFVYGDMDGAPGTGMFARSTAPAVKGAWVHLAGVYDAQAGQMKLYVNGALQSTLGVPNPWNAAGPVNIGRVLWRGGMFEHWVGSIDEIRIYQGVITNIAGIS